MAGLAALVLAAVLPCLTDSGPAPAALHAAGGGPSLPAGGAQTLPLLLALRGGVGTRRRSTTAVRRRNACSRCMHRISASQAPPPG